MTDRAISAFPLSRMMPASTMKPMRLILICSLALRGSSCGGKNETTGRSHWTVTVGGESREQLYERLRKTSISEQNEDESFLLLVKDSPDFKVSPTREELDLVVVTAEELRLPTAMGAADSIRRVQGQSHGSGIRTPPTRCYCFAVAVDAWT